MVLTQEIIERGIRDCRLVSCSELHENSCNMKFLEQFTNGCRSLYKLYLIIHLAPVLLFKTKRFRQHFYSELLTVLTKLAQSLIFAGLFPAIARRIMCFITQIYGFEGNFMPLASGIGALSIMFEAKSRQAEVALYVTTKTLDIMHGWVKRRGFDPQIKNFSVYLFGFTMAVFGFFYQQEPQTIKSSYASILSKVIGPV